MKLRAPAYPLINVDPYFTVWSMADRLHDVPVKHWTGSDNTLIGVCSVDGEEKLFMGVCEGRSKMEQVSVDVTALSTTYVFTDGKIRLTVRFTTPLLPDDLTVLTRPVGYIALSYKSVDGEDHTVTASVLASEEFVMNKRGDDTTEREVLTVAGMPTVKMGKTNQTPLNRSGDDLRIEWGYLYLTAPRGEVREFVCDQDKMGYIMGTVPVSPVGDSLILLAYDDCRASIQYFGETLASVWNRNGETIETAIEAAYNEYPALITRCDAFSDKLYCDAVRAGGVQYAEMLSLAYRQAISAHKCVVDTEGQVLFISKECFSNGCAATVDVSYPSIPLFLLYNPELVKGMTRPIFKYAESEAWPFDFAPHDAGQYPLVNGQVYGNNAVHMQMPVEECGNMLVMVTTTAIAEGDISFAEAHWNTLADWVKYLLRYGEDPENQLCTDDFAGHLAHNCNLSIKAIMGVACFGLLHRMKGGEAEYEHYIAEARRMATSWTERASNGAGSYRLAFDRPGTYSMKYNAVWDKLFGTHIFPAEVLESEAQTNFTHFKPYGMPLDNRADYTKSDWLVWTATLLQSDADFERYVAPLWTSYHFTRHRVPMTDWYDTIGADHIHFQNRTVIGGLFIKLLEWSGKMKV